MGAERSLRSSAQSVEERDRLYRSGSVERCRIDAFSARLIDRIFWRVIFILGFIFLGLAILRQIPRRTAQPRR